AELEQSLRIHSMISCPALRQVNDIDVSADPPIVVLEWPSDSTLADRIEQGPALSRHAAQLAAELAFAAGAAHRMGLVHGTFVPSLVRLDPKGQPRPELTGVRTWDPADFAPLDRA